MTNINAQIFTSRWNKKWDAPHAPWKATLDNAVLMTGAAKYQLGEIKSASNGRLTEQGIREELRKKLETDIVLGRLKRDQARVNVAREELAQKRSALANFKYDRDDLLAAMHRREMRDHIRKLSTAEQSALLLKSAAAREAVYEVPQELSGVIPLEYDRWRQYHVEQTSGPQLAEIAEQSAVLDLVGAAITVAINEAKAESGLDSRQADDWIASVAA